MSTALETGEEIIRLTAAELVRRIAGGELSSLEVVNAHIARIERINPALNAMVAPRFDLARAEARDVDARRQRGESLGALGGLPVTIKDMFDVAGMATTIGMPHRARAKAAADAVVVRRMRAAGAVVLGKTNVPQGGMMFESDNPLYGRTNNPWNAARTPGGSSGGEAALIAAGGSPLGVGSDGGGSIRYPCHASGVCGLKPTFGRLSLAGHWLYPGYPPGWAAPGPLARSVEDLTLAMRVLGDSAHASDDPAAAPLAPVEPGRVSVSGLRIGFYTDDGYLRTAPGLRRAVREAAAALTDLGAEVAEFHPPDVRQAWSIYSRLMYADGLAHFREDLRGSRLDWRVRQLLLFAWAPTLARRPAAALFRFAGQRRLADMFRMVPRRTLSARRYFDLVEEDRRYRLRFQEAVDRERFDAWICPPSAVPAIDHGNWFGSLAGEYTTLYNLLGMPAGVVPATRVRAGEESDRPKSRDMIERALQRAETGGVGLPVGVQVVAPHWREDTVLAVMAALEAHFRAGADYPAWPPL